MNQHPDHQYLLAFRAGDYSKLEELYGSQARTVASWVVQNNGSIADAEDVFQEGVIALCQKAQDESFVLTCPIGALLFSICRNKWLNRLRKNNREAEVRKAQAVQLPHENIVQNDLEAVEEEAIRQQKLDKAFQQLSPLCQKLLRLLSAGAASQEVAEALEMTNANTVYRRKNACIERWRHLFQSAKI